MLFTVIFICVFYPYFIGIKRKFPEGISFFVEVIITTSLVFNVLMTLMTAVKTKKDHITAFFNILRYRMDTLGFYLDVVSIIPFEYIVTIHTTVKYHDNYRDHLFYLCKGVKLCLIWRLSYFFESLERQLLLNSLVIKVNKIFIHYLYVYYFLS